MSTLRTDYLQTTDSAITVAVASLVSSSNSSIQAYQNITALRAAVLSTGAVVKTLGYYSAGDSGPGAYYHDSSDTTSTDNGGTVIVTSEGKRLKLIRDTEVTVKTFGARGNGTTDDTAAVTAVISAGFPVIFPTGTYPLTATTFTTPVVFRDGASISASVGTFAFNGGFSAPIAKVFNFTGTAVATFDFSKTYQGYPEWWGAVAGNISIDNTAAINAAIVACREVGLLPVIYYVAGTIKMQLDHRRLFGAGKSWTISVGGTQIISTSASATIIKMGLDSNPGSVNSNLTHLRIENLTLNRSVATLDSTSTCYGIDSSWVLFGHIQDVESINSKIGFYYSGDVQVWSTRCYSFRSTPGSVPASDTTYGYLFNGNSTLALAGGNASMYMRDCSASSALTVAQSPIQIGFGMDGRPADLFCFGCEVGTMTQGMFINCSNTLAGDADIRIDNFVADGMVTDGILITNCAGAIRITNSYAAPASTSTSFTGLRVQNSRGVSEDGNQWICWPAANSCGVRFVTNSGCSIGAGTVIRDAARPIEVDSSAQCVIKGQIINTQVSCTQGAVLVTTGTNRCDFAVAVTGDIAGRFTYGYRTVDATPTYNKFDWTSIQPNALTSSLPANRLVYNGTAVGTTVGTLSNGNFSVGQSA